MGRAKVLAGECSGSMAAEGWGEKERGRSSVNNKERGRGGGVKITTASL